MFYPSLSNFMHPEPRICDVHFFSLAARLEQLPEVQKPIISNYPQLA